MKFVADLHIHSHFSRATSKTLSPEFLDLHAGMKGIKVVGTGDFTHPGWLEELKKKTEPEDNGLFRLKKEYRIESPFGDNQTRFMLTAEISNIYKRGGKVRKVHNVVLVPGFEEAEKINQRLLNLGGNLTSDGRPILGLDSRDLLEIVLDCDENNYFIPAHIWTPWFSMLGSKSGFDSLEECFADLAPHIHTIETGLSTDPPMNWLCSFLDKVTLVSNSDAHSPDRLGRNASVFDTEISYNAMIEALRTGNPEKYNGTIDMFPQEGKYHYDGHRKCGVCWDPAETLRQNSICPGCSRPVTIGVMNRVIQLSDREDISERPNKLPFRSIIPLKEILSEVAGVGIKSKKVEAEYQQTVQKLGTELDILLHLPLDEIERKTRPVLAEAIRRMRNREIIVQEGFDGEYGIIKVFRPGETLTYETGNALFQIDTPVPPKPRALIDFDLKGIQKLLHQKEEMLNIAAENETMYTTGKTTEVTFDNLNAQQFEAVQHINGPSLIIAGPGTGKTKTLTSKIAWLIGNHYANPEEILAITFTSKAAGELKERLKKLPGSRSNTSEVKVATFHAFGLSILKEHCEKFDRTKKFMLADEHLKLEVIQSVSDLNRNEAKKVAAKISEIKTGTVYEDTIFRNYEAEMQKLNAFDLDDLISKPLQLLHKYPEIAENYRRQFQYFFVDEYQDTNDAQYKLLRLLAPDSAANLCAVGDANQSIYGFRGSNASYIQQFTEDYQNAKVFRLTKSYRCSQTILTASSNIISGNSGFLEGITEGVQISISGQPTGASEAEFIARQIVEMTGGVSFFSLDSSVAKGEASEKSLSDFAVLCRTRSQFEAVAKALEDHHIPYQETGTLPFFKQPPFDAFIGFLSGFLIQTYETAEPLFRLNKKPVTKMEFDLAKKELDRTDLPTFLEFIKDHQFSAESFGETDWKRFIHLVSGTKNLNELLHFIQLSSGQDVYEKNLEAVSLMTLHASKGLEFECVFIPGCEDGLLPYNLYKKEVDTEEEKRLLYVGMTRAKKTLFLTHAKSRTIRGRKFNLPKSPFLDSIQQELVQQIKSKPHKKKGEKNNQLSLF